MFKRHLAGFNLFFGNGLGLRVCWHPHAACSEGKKRLYDKRYAPATNYEAWTSEDAEVQILNERVSAEIDEDGEPDFDVLCTIPYVTPACLAWLMKEVSDGKLEDIEERYYKIEVKSLTYEDLLKNLNPNPFEGLMPDDHIN